MNSFFVPDPGLFLFLRFDKCITNVLLYSSKDLIFFMRQVISLSFPSKTTTEVKRLAKKRGFDSVSGYIQYLIKMDQDLISEESLWDDIKQARNEYKTGKVIKAKSLSELL
ncbi:hypothetical protein CO172_00420 [Candidatus Uhrbacteria bacterium CG_4_9_14_3_um_filter_36_7]|uniref:Uncharacterized protein n=1 Tax=Candidatus Uhrbacteria bacterium CG_4_9_14_3_um_filter_36_7 TaxID=1975033 RepID=A0A2M7XIG7_9BACT|nr:MAG: hypothetical protein CO172_00420 [Candidatus Uhrbacteria bacterium CG_4_9_14_3_um_filter_36_7]